MSTGWRLAYSAFRGPSGRGASGFAAEPGTPSTTNCHRRAWPVTNSHAARGRTRRGTGGRVKRHRFDPLPFTFGLLFAFVALFVLLGNSLADLAPVGLWTLPAMTIGLLIVLYGVAPRGAAPRPTNTPPAPAPPHPT